MTNLIGQSLGRYHILEQLGEGGMAVVYKAYDTRLESEVAVKVIRTENLAPSILERSLKRFEREAKALAKLTHANIVNVLDYGEYEGKPYLVMPYLPGGTLKERLQGKPMAYQEATQILIPVSRALAYAHQQGLVHRDVKPSNILITQSGDPMLTDFGIAKIIDEEATMDLTGTSATVGTPEYMAPEQVVSKSVDHRADIYALGVVFYEMVTGRKPFMADTPMAVLFKHASEPLPRPKNFVPSLPDAVEHILLKALAKKPEDRYQNMSDFATALENLLTYSLLPQVEKPEQAPRTGEGGKHHVATQRDSIAAIAQNESREAHSQKATTDKAREVSKKVLWPWALGGLLTIVIGGFLAVIFFFSGASTPPSPTSPAVPVHSVTIQPSPSETLLPSKTSTPNSTPTEAFVSTGVSKGNINMRAGPDTVYPVLTQIATGTELTLVGRNNDGTWLIIRTPDNQEGWVLTTLIETSIDISSLPITKAPPPPTLPPSIPTKTKKPYGGAILVPPALKDESPLPGKSSFRQILSLFSVIGLFLLAAFTQKDNLGKLSRRLVKTGAIWLMELLIRL